MINAPVPLQESFKTADSNVITQELIIEPSSQTGIPFRFYTEMVLVFDLTPATVAAFFSKGGAISLQYEYQKRPITRIPLWQALISYPLHALNSSDVLTIVDTYGNLSFPIINGFNSAIGGRTLIGRRPVVVTPNDRLILELAGLDVGTPASLIGRYFEAPTMQELLQYAAFE